MNKDALVEKIEALVRPIAEELNYELYYVEYVKEDGEFYLRIYIDKSEGSISLNDCEAVSRRVSDMLDVEDPIKDSYFLEVSSPGLNRGLYKDSHFEKYIGKDVFVKFNGSLSGMKNIKGVLKEVNAEDIVVAGETELTIPKNKIKNANLDGEI